MALISSVLYIGIFATVEEIKGSSLIIGFYFFHINYYKYYKLLNVLLSLQFLQSGPTPSPK